MLKKYKRKEDILVVQWDGKDETIELIKQEICSTVEDSEVNRCLPPGDTHLQIKLKTNIGLHTVFFRVGDYVVLDKTRFSPIVIINIGTEEELLSNYVPA